MAGASYNLDWITFGNPSRCSLTVSLNRFPDMDDNAVSVENRLYLSEMGCVHSSMWNLIGNQKKSMRQKKISAEKTSNFDHLCLSVRLQLQLNAKSRTGSLIASWPILKKTKKIKKTTKNKSRCSITT